MQMRALPALVLAAILSLTSVSVGASRGQADPVDSLVICTGHGFATVYLDAQGAPVAVPHICPDCVLFLSWVPGDPAVVPAPAPVKARAPIPFVACHSPSAVASAQARGPPGAADLRTG